MALWTEIIHPAELTEFSRYAFEQLDTGLFSTILPNIYQGDQVFTWRVNEVLHGVAEFGELDTEAPIGDGRGGQEKSIRLLTVSKKLRLSEYEQLTNANADRVRTLAEEKLDAVVRFVINRLSQARVEALVNGSLNINENGLKALVNFERSADQTLVTPGTMWSATGSDPIADLSAWSDRVADRSGARPDVIAGSRRVRTAIGARLFANGYVTANQGLVAADAINQVLTSHDLPAFTVYEGRINNQRAMADNVLIMAPSNGAAGATVHGPTLESFDPRYGLAGVEPGIVAGLYSEDDPPVRWALGKTRALPILANPDTTLSATVL